MAVLFDGKAGVAVSMFDSSKPGAPITVEGLEGSFENFKAIVTGISVRQQENLLFSHTLGDFIYIYVFGERIGEIVITGLAFIDDCRDDGATGAAGVLQYYRANRVSSRPTPISVQIGSQAEGVIEGFLISMDISIVDPLFKLGQFALRMALLPPSADTEESI